MRATPHRLDLRFPRLGLSWSPGLPSLLWATRIPALSPHSIALLLWRNGDPVGAIAIGRAELDGAALPFSKRDSELANTFAEQAVIAIESTRSFKEAQARARELTESLQRRRDQPTCSTPSIEELETEPA
jgi:GAF domain-containing protein